MRLAGLTFFARACDLGEGTIGAVGPCHNMIPVRQRPLVPRPTSHLVVPDGPPPLPAVERTVERTMMVGDDEFEVVEPPAIVPAPAGARRLVVVVCAPPVFVAYAGMAALQALLGVFRAVPTLAKRAHGRLGTEWSRALARARRVGQ